MGVYFDTPRERSSNVYKKAKVTAHLRADTEEELAAFALQIGLKPEWYQKSIYPALAWKSHYDLIGKDMIEKARRHRAVELTPQEFVIRAKKNQK